MSFQSGQVKQVIRQFAIEIQTDSKKDLEQDAVVLKLRRAMGANCEFMALRQPTEKALLTASQTTDKVQRIRSHKTVVWRKMKGSHYIFEDEIPSSSNLSWNPSNKI